MTRMPAPSCKGVCARYKGVRRGRGSMYDQGLKRCKRCSIFVEWKGMWCPCCGNKLSMHGTGSNWKRRRNVRESKGIIKRQ